MPFQDPSPSSGRTAAGVVGAASAIEAFGLQDDPHTVSVRLATVPPVDAVELDEDGRGSIELRHQVFWSAAATPTRISSSALRL
ncbi:MAG: hypothetical protein QM658_17610 [Gordonia sp. (in: high G+C Gram-positive bacteria)]